MAHLENWSIKNLPLGGRLIGVCTEHPVVADGAFVVTSPVTAFSAENKTATTRSGTAYTLGTPNPLWLEWLAVTHTTIESFNKAK